MNQRDIEEKYSRANIRQVVLTDITPDSPVLLEMAEAIAQYRAKQYYASKQNRIWALAMSSKDIALELLSLVLLIKEITPIQSVAAQLGARLGYENILDAVKTASEIIAVAEISGAYTLFHAQDYENNNGTMSIRANYALEGPTQQLINQTKYLPPMIEPPIGWVSNKGGGYNTTKDSVILGQANHHNGYQALDVINLLQSIPWQLNEMVEFMEIPNKELDTQEKRVQFEDMRNESTRVYKELIEQSNQFYFVWKFDKRGRMYSQGYHCNLQGTEYKKAILSFANEELIQ